MADTTFTCSTCHEAPPFEGFDECLPCAVAIQLVEDPDYINFARKHFAGTSWLADLEREWNRQLSALVACGKAAA